MPVAKWTDCAHDVRVHDDDGSVIYSAPRYFRCVRPECRKLVTPGMSQRGGCACGGRKYNPATSLSLVEKIKLKVGFYYLCDWEKEQIKPLVSQKS